MYKMQNSFATTEELYVISFIEINLLKILGCLSSQISVVIYSTVYLSVIDPFKTS